MILPKFSEIQRLDAALLEGLPALRVAILRNVVLDPVVPYLRWMAYQEGFRAECRFGEYDNVVQEAVGGAPELLGESTDAVLVFLRLETLSWDLARNFAALAPDAIAAETDRIRRLVADVLAGIRRQTPAMVLWHGIETPLYPALGVLDAQRPDGQAAVVQQLNAAVRETLQQHRSAYFVDLDRCLARVGAGAFYDARYWHAARAPYTLEALREIAGEDLKFLRALKGRARKCLVLDCDGVLWGGIVGEDGMAGIALGTAHPGSAHYEFQQEVLNLHHRGVVLALCSKNEAADVWEVFDRHPDMLLKRPHIAAARINWEDKAANLRALADELNLGLDSFVFVDDSDFEVDLVRRVLPMVATIQLPPNRASEHRAILASCGLFDTLTLSAEDRARGAAYQAEAARRQLQVASGDMASYLRSLEITVELRPAEAFTVPRIAQLTQKTNQFNLTTRRYSEEDIRRLAEDPAADVVSMRYRDRFGDAGLVGVGILRYTGGEAVFDTLLMSCRVLGRGVEDAFLVHCLLRARERGARTAVGRYRPTAKNAQVREFFPARGFAAAGEDAEGATYRLDLSGYRPTEPDGVQVDSTISHAAAGQAAGVAGTQGEPRA